MKKQIRLRMLHFGLPVGLLILTVLLQVFFYSDGPMTGAAFVDPDQEEEYLASKTDRMDGEEVIAWSPAQKVAGFRNHDRIYTTRTVLRGEHVFPLPTSDRQLSRLDYRVWNYQLQPVVVPLFKHYDIDDFILHNNITGLIVIKSG
ncbi:MAG: hypothetical protein HN445_04705, partial [Bacteroidetes Order II. Incertae sedis bacterium]|nr:hypothetical protein [Bacteroidetes Order II. bacterium]